MSEVDPGDIPKARGKIRRGARHPHSHAREVILQAIYQMEVANHSLAHVLQFLWLNEKMDEEKDKFCRTMLNGVADNWDAIDEVIRSFSAKDFSQLSVVVKSILRSSIYEIMRGELDVAIIIDDALNLTRKYDGEDSVPFVNAVLDGFERERRNTEEET